MKSNGLLAVIVLSITLTLFIIPQDVFADTTGPQSPTVAATTPGAINDFTLRTNALSSDNSYAIGQNNDDQAYGAFGFDLSIPDGATINGITVSLEGRRSSALCGAIIGDPKFSVQLSDPALVGAPVGLASFIGDTKTTTDFTNTVLGSDQIKTLGSSSDTWSNTYTDLDNFWILITSECGTIITFMMLDHVTVDVDYTEPVVLTGGSSVAFQGPTLGELNDGRLIVSDGFCFDLFCLDVLEYFNHLPIQQVDSGTTHTISMTAHCPSGSNRCNYASVGAAPPGTDINAIAWNVALERIGLSDDWQVTKVDPNGMLGDVTGTVQVVDASKIQYTFNIQFITPASIGTVDGNAEPPEDNMILVTEIRDSKGGAARNIFNEGVFVNDIYAYPQVDASYAPPVKVEQLCLNEDSTDRNTCAFEQVRQWTIKQAEEKLKEISEQNNYKTD